MIHKKILVTALLLLGTITTASAQWTKGKSNGYYKLSAWYLEADQHYTNTGDIDPNATRGLFTTSLYREYGIHDKWDVIAFLPFFSRTFQNDQVSQTTGLVTDPGEAVNSVGDFILGARYGILKTDKWALAAKLSLGIPVGESKGGSDGSFQTGDGEFNQQLDIELGKPLQIGKSSAYAKTYLGFNNRTNNFSDELRYGAEFGVSFVKQTLWTSVKLNGVESLHNGSRNASNSQGSVFANNIEYLSIGGEVAYKFYKNWGVSAHIDSAVSGKLIYAAPSFGGGIFFEIK